MYEPSLREKSGLRRAERDMSFASALRHAGAKIQALCIALVAAARPSFKRGTATPGNGNVSTSVDDRRELPYMLVEWSAKLTVCLVAILLALIGYVALFVIVIKTVALVSSPVDLGLVFLSMVVAGIVVVLVLCYLLYRIVSWRSVHPA
ncbi:hypothetical protein MRX96_000584 [Rhipicephalus microplus]